MNTSRIVTALREGTDRSAKAQHETSRDCRLNTPAVWVYKPEVIDGQLTFVGKRVDEAPATYDTKSFDQMMRCEAYDAKYDTNGASMKRYDKEGRRSDRKE